MSGHTKDGQRYKCTERQEKQHCFAYAIEYKVVRYDEGVYVVISQDGGYRTTIDGVDSDETATDVCMGRAETDGRGCCGPKCII